MDWTLISNLVRIGVITLAFFSVFVGVATYLMFRKRTKFEKANYLPHRSEIKQHIVLVTAGMVTISLYTAAEMYTHYNRPMTWRSPTLLLAFSIFAVSHWKMYGLQTATYERDKARVEIAGARGEAENKESGKA